MPKQTCKPLLVLVASGRKEYREDALVSISSRFRVHLIEGTEPTWQRPYLESYDVVPDFEEATLVTVVEQLAKGNTLAGVLCWDEARILPATLLAAKLGLPSAGSEAVMSCRDKYLTRTKLAKHGIGQPRFAIASDVESALEAADKIGYPIILKPRSAAASLGVVLVSDAGELAEQFPFASGASIAGAPTHQHPVLLEEFVAGNEISVDCLVEDGVATPLVVARKSVGFAPFFEEVGHEVDSSDPLLTDPNFADTVQRIHAALDFGWAWTHVEMKLTDRGPMLIEVNARIGGGLISRLAYLALGIDAASLAADAACGIIRASADVAPLPRTVAANRFLYTHQDDVVVRSVRFDEQALPNEIDRAVVLTEPGAQLRLPPEGLFSGRAGVVVVSANDDQAVRRALRAATNAFKLEVSPLQDTAK